MPIDARIALGVQAPQIDDPLTAQTKRLQLSDLMGRQQMQQFQLQGAQRETQDQQTLADLYRQHGDNPQALIGGMAQSGLGARIPAFQAQQAKTQKEVIDMANVRSQIGERDFKVLRDSNKMISEGLASLAGRPNVTEQDVASFIGQLAGSGALDVQSKLAGADRNSYAMQLMQGMPKGNPAALKTWLIEHGLTVMDNGKRMDLVLGKTEMQDQGGARQAFTTFPITGEVRPGASFGKTATPDEVMKDATARRGQNMTDARARETNAAVVGKPFEVTDPNTGQPVLVRQDRAGTVSPVPGFQPKGMGATKLTEDQGKATGWLAQATNAFGNMQKAMTSSPDASRPGFPDVVGKVPGLGGAANMMRGADRQKFMQGASSLSEALLRAATGAGVNRDEATQKVQELTPVFGDSEETIQQKMAAIPVYIESLKVRAGPGSKQIPGIFERAKPARGLAPQGSPIVNDQQYEALPSGALFTGPDGKTRRKP